MALLLKKYMILLQIMKVFSETDYILWIKFTRFGHLLLPNLKEGVAGGRTGDVLASPPTKKQFVTSSNVQDFHQRFMTKSLNY